MSYYLLEPEVAGGLGDRTVMDSSTHPPRVARLHYQLDDWMGDGLLESFPCFVVTQRLGDALEQAELTGFALADVEISVSDTGAELLGDTRLPDFRWLRVAGAPGADDFGLAGDGSLVVSERAFEVLRTGGIDNCDIEEWPEGR